jgi:hypothetical protein
VQIGPLPRGKSPISLPPFSPVPHFFDFFCSENDNELMLSKMKNIPCENPGKIVSTIEYILNK